MSANSSQRSLASAQCSQRARGRRIYYNEASNSHKPSESSHVKDIRIPSHTVGRIIGKGGSTIRKLTFDSEANINIGDRTNDFHTIVTVTGTDQAIAKAEEMIMILSENPPPKNVTEMYGSSVSNRTSNFFKLNNAGVQVIDWDKLNAHHDHVQCERWKKLPPIVKDFYEEDPAMAMMSRDEVSNWRLTNHSELRAVPNPVLTFEQAFHTYPQILTEIHKQDFIKPIQSQAWPIHLRGDDMIGIAQTGTGKTLAFLLPALIHIDGQPIPRKERQGPTVLVSAPTRELAVQIHKEEELS